MGLVKFIGLLLLLWIQQGAVGLTCNLRTLLDDPLSGLDTSCSAQSSASFQFCVRWYSTSDSAWFATGASASQVSTFQQLASSSPSTVSQLLVCQSNQCVRCDFSVVGPLPGAPPGPTPLTNLHCNTRFKPSNGLPMSECDSNVISTEIAAACVRYSTSNGLFTGPASLESITNLEILVNQGSITNFVKCDHQNYCIDCDFNVVSAVNSPPFDSSSNNGLSPGAIAGIVIGSIGGTALLLLAAATIRKHVNARRKSSLEIKSSMPLVAAATPLSSSNPSGPSSRRSGGV